jgi:FMN phosphatase YigB (HAD superfamily)
MSERATNDAFDPKSSEITIKILEKIRADEIKVVSFDLFDTLLLRPTLYPTDVLKLVGARMDIPYFLHKRKLSQAHASNRKNPLYDDITIDEIYFQYSRLFGRTCEDERIHAIKECELDTERQLLYPRAYGKFLFEEAKTAGKRIYILSDMYLPTGFLADVLQANGYCGYEKLYVSSELRKTKYSGRMYQHIILELREQGIKPEQILHIGDDSTSDISIARREGLKTIHVPGPVAQMFAFAPLKQITVVDNRYETSNNNFFYGLMANELFDYPWTSYSKNFLYNDATVTGILMAPLIIAFMHSTLRQIKSRGVEQVLLCGKTNRILSEIYRLLEPFIHVNASLHELTFPEKIRSLLYVSRANAFTDYFIDGHFSRHTTIDTFLTNILGIKNKDEYDQALEIFLRNGWSFASDEIGDIFDLTVGRKIATVTSSFDELFIKRCQEEYSPVFTEVARKIAPSKMTSAIDIGFDAPYSRLISEKRRMSIESYHFMDYTDTRGCDPFIVIDKEKFKKAKYKLETIVRNVFENSDNKKLNKATKANETENRNVLQSLCKGDEIISDIICEGIISFTGKFTGVFGNLLPLLRFNKYALFKSYAHLTQTPGENKGKNSNQITITRPKFKFSRQKIKKYAWNVSAKFGILGFTRRIYHIMRDFLKPKVDWAETYRKQFASNIESYRNSPLANQDNNIIVLALTNENMIKLFNSFAEKNSDYNFIFLEIDSDAERRHNAALTNYFRITIPPVILRFNFGNDAPSCDFKIDAETKTLLSQYDYLQRSVEQGKSDRTLGKGGSEFFTAECERYYKAIFEIFTPKLLICWNNLFGGRYIASHLAKRIGIPCVVCESGMLSGTISIDTMGCNGESRPSVEVEQFLELPVDENDIIKAEEIISFLNRTGLNRRIQTVDTVLLQKLSQLDKTKPTISFFGAFDPHLFVPYDEHARKFNSPVFKSTIETAKYLVSLARKNEWNVIFKPHPIANNKSLTYPQPYPKGAMVIESGDINLIIDASDVIISTSSSVPYNALTREKPVVMLGYMPCKGKGFTYEAFSLDAVEPQIKAAIEHGYTAEQRAAFVKHVAQLNKYYLFDNLQDRALRYGRTPEQAAQFLRDVMEGKNPL